MATSLGEYKDFVQAWFTAQETRLRKVLDQELKDQLVKFVDLLHKENVLCMRGTMPTLQLTVTRDKIGLYWPKWDPANIMIEISKKGPSACVIMNEMMPYRETSLISVLKDLNSRSK